MGLGRTGREDFAARVDRRHRQLPRDEGVERAEGGDVDDGEDED